MSRYEINCRDPRYRAVVGWDPPLRTFFLQVFDRELSVCQTCQGIGELVHLKPRPGDVVVDKAVVKCPDCDDGKGEDEIIIWLGGEPPHDKLGRPIMGRAVYVSIAEIAVALAPYANLPDDIIVHLVNDRG